MITDPTVLVLGAGASRHLDFPLANELGNLIITRLKNLEGEEAGQLVTLGFSKDIIRDFRLAYKYSGKVSVDAFLEHRAEFVPVGRAAIAQALIPHERYERLFERTSNWYQYLYEKLNVSFDSFGKNQLSVVTFNYDRSLEHYLFTALRYSYNKNEAAAAKALASIPIVHVHGRLGCLPWQGTRGRDYRPAQSIEDLKVAWLC